MEVEVEVDSDELEIERDDAELVEASYEAGGVEIDIEAEVESHGSDDEGHEERDHGEHGHEDEDGEGHELDAKCRIDTANELAYYHHGGILHYVLRKMIGAA